MVGRSREIPGGPDAFACGAVPEVWMPLCASSLNLDPVTGGVSLAGSWQLPTPVFLTSLMAQLVKNPPAMQETWVRSLGWEDLLEKGKTPQSSILARRIPWTVYSVGSQRVRYDRVTFTYLHFIYLLMWGSSPSSIFLNCHLSLLLSSMSYIFYHLLSNVWFVLPVCDLPFQFHDGVWQRVTLILIRHQFIHAFLIWFVLLVS